MSRSPSSVASGESFVSASSPSLVSTTPSAAAAAAPAGGGGIVNHIKIYMNGWVERLRDPRCGGATGAVAGILFVGLLVLFAGIHRVVYPAWYVDPLKCDLEDDQRLQQRRNGWHLVVLGALVSGPAFMALHSLTEKRD